MLEFIEYKNGEIELIKKDKEGKIEKYIASWRDIIELKESLKNIEAYF